MPTSGVACMNAAHSSCDRRGLLWELQFPSTSKDVWVGRNNRPLCVVPRVYVRGRLWVVFDGNLENRMGFSGIGVKIGAWFPSWTKWADCLFSMLNNSIIPWPADQCLQIFSHPSHFLASHPSSEGKMKPKIPSNSIIPWDFWPPIPYYPRLILIANTNINNNTYSFLKPQHLSWLVMLNMFFFIEAENKLHQTPPPLNIQCKTMACAYYT